MVGAGYRSPYGDAVMNERDDDKTVGGTLRATRRPLHMKAPAEWSNSPLPEPALIREEPAEEQPGKRNPVRYGDWELKGLAIDF